MIVIFQLKTNVFCYRLHIYIYLRPLVIGRVSNSPVMGMKTGWKNLLGKGRFLINSECCKTIFTIITFEVTKELCPIHTGDSISSQL